MLRLYNTNIPNNEKKSSMHHHLKTESQYFQAIERGEKKFELRKNDRNFQLHDLVTLVEVVDGIPTGRQLAPFEIKYLLLGGQFGLPEGYCIFNW
jgi:hypothetical protein